MTMRNTALLLLVIGAVGATTPALAGHHGVDAGIAGSDLRDRHGDARGEKFARDDSANDSAGDSAGGAVSPRQRSGDAVRVSMDDAVGRVLSAYGGRVVAASSVSSGQGMGYRIRVLQADGRVHTVFVDAATGAMREMN